MAMVVECASCRSRFRLKKTLLKGASEIRFRCRTCGGPIVVRNPEISGNAPIPSLVPSPAPSPVPPVPLVPPASPIVPAPPAADREPARPAIGPDTPAQPGASAPMGTRLEDLFPLSPKDGVGHDRSAIVVAGGVKRAAKGPRSNIREGRARSVGSRSLIAGLGILLLAGGAYHFWTTYYRGASPGRVSSSPGTSVPGDPASKPVYEIQNLRSYIPQRAVAGNLLVVTGSVMNVGKVRSRGIRVRAILFGKDNQVLMEQAAIAGNQIDEKSLPYVMQITIEGHMAHKDGEGTGNRDIPPGKSLSFMVVFFDPPGNVETFKVLALDDDQPLRET